MVSAVILATGRAGQVGEDGLLQRGIESALASDLHEIICVVRDLVAVRQKISLVDKRLYWVINDSADNGQSSSIIAGLWAIDPKSDGALFIPADQPKISPALIHSLVERFESTHAPIVEPSSQGQFRNPILFRRDLFPKLLQLTGDQDGRGLIERYREKRALVE